MRRIAAQRRKARAFWFSRSQSLASRRQRFSQAMVRSTIQRFGSTTKRAASERLTISTFTWLRFRQVLIGAHAVPTPSLGEGRHRPVPSASPACRPAGRAPTPIETSTCPHPVWGPSSTRRCSLGVCRSAGQQRRRRPSGPASNGGRQADAARGQPNPSPNCSPSPSLPRCGRACSRSPRGSPKSPRASASRLLNLSVRLEHCRCCIARHDNRVSFGPGSSRRANRLQPAPFPLRWPTRAQIPLPWVNVSARAVRSKPACVPSSAASLERGRGRSTVISRTMRAGVPASSRTRSAR